MSSSNHVTPDIDEFIIPDDLETPNAPRNNQGGASPFSPFNFLLKLICHQHLEIQVANYL